MENKHFETTWKTADGLEIYAQGWEPEQAAPKAVFCLVHGIGEHSSRYGHVAAALCQAGFAFSGFDLRGHGKSEGRKGHFPSSDAVLQDIDLLLDHTRVRFPGLPLILYGHSLGGILVLYYTLKRKPEIKGVLATSPGLHTALEKQPVKIWAAKILGSILPELTLKTGLDQNALSQDRNVVETYRKDPLVHDLMSLGFGKTMLGIIRRTIEHAPEFTLPLLLIHGKLDSIAYPVSSTDFASRIKENCRLVFWENGYHELHNEPFKEEVFETMISWANTISAASGGR